MAADYFDLHLTHAGCRSGEFETLWCLSSSRKCGRGMLLPYIDDEHFKADLI